MGVRKPYLKMMKVSAIVLVMGLFVGVEAYTRADYCTRSYTATISFKVKAKTDAHILLSQHYGGDGHEIVIGGWSNTQSAIRDSKQKPHPGYAVTKTSNYLSSSYFRGFWINLKHDGTKLYVSVGRMYYSSPFMSYALNYKHSINYIAFAAWEKNYG